MVALVPFPALTSPVRLAEALEPRWVELVGGGWSPVGGAQEPLTLGCFIFPRDHPHPLIWGQRIQAQPERKEQKQATEINSLLVLRKTDSQGGSFLRADKPYCSDSPKPFRGAESQRETGPRPHSGNSPLTLRPPYGLII